MSVMKFSDVLRTTSSQFAWSPDGKYCAISVTARLEIRDGVSFQILTVFNCMEPIQVFEWSPDSLFIYSANLKKGLVEVWHIKDSSWRCKIEEGSLGIAKLCWNPDSRHLLTVSEFYLRITIWSLISKTVYHLRNPKDASPGFQFSYDGDYLAIAERHECKDFLSIIEAKSWSKVKMFEVSTRDLKGIAWSPDDSVIAVWESPVEYKLLIYTVAGQCLSSFCAYQPGLGIKCVSWSPSSQFVAIGSYDQKIRVMNHITWRILFEFEHTKIIEDDHCVIFKESEENLTGFPATLAAVQGLSVCLKTNYEELKIRPVNLGEIPLELGKEANSKAGVSNINFSSDGRYMCSKFGNMPATAWIWNVEKLCLAATLVHCNIIKDMKWCPKRICLALCTGGNHLYLWTPFGAMTVTIPLPNSALFQVSNLRWNSTGSNIALLSRDSVTICSFNSDNNNKVDEESLR